MKNFHGSVLCLALAIGILTDCCYLPENFRIPAGKIVTDRLQEPDNPSLSEHKLWLRYQKINPDLKAVLVFENGLLSLPVVQSHDNTTYLRRGFDGSYDRKGTPFLDCQDHLSDPVFLIYGHLVYYDPSRAFSPLVRLETQEGFEKNHSFFLILEEEIRAYEIVSVFRITIQSHAFDQRKSSFSDRKDFDQWIGYAQNHNEIESREHAQMTDHFCLLQTCVRDNENQRLIVLAREKYR